MIINIVNFCSFWGEKMGLSLKVFIFCAQPAQKCHFANGLCFDKIISLYFGAPKTTTIDIGVKRKRHFCTRSKTFQK
jgi:hypothetical protein